MSPAFCAGFPVLRPQSLLSSVISTEARSNASVERRPECGTSPFPEDRTDRIYARERQFSKGSLLCFAARFRSHASQHHGNRTVNLRAYSSAPRHVVELSTPSVEMSFEKRSEIEHMASPAGPSSTGSTRNNSQVEHGDVEKALSIHEGKDVTATVNQAVDPDVVDWDGPDDPENPLNWTSRRKWANIGFLSMITLLTLVAARQFENEHATAILTIS
ncbi:hypothetical protein CLCR_07587 [Cladophialophora carrionii]|uniref:Uncharacterized protein n=1 Tax=Cladophialophora carrionii TaxID=86049 RepID=A0A1C1CPF9_9EURO|nr:hypothetical protein CLCR_07587 [Cladophialophora carrionii]